jgi:hypothetical protein
LSNKLGRLDPKTGAIKDSLKTPHTGPHGLTEVRAPDDCDQLFRLIATRRSN